MQFTKYNKWKGYFVLILTFYFSQNSFCQEVLKPSAYPSGIYIKENTGTRTVGDEISLSWDKLNTPVYSFDTADIENAEMKINYFRKYFSKAPFSFNECIYILPANSKILNAGRRTILNANSKTVQHYKIEPVFISPFLFYSDTLSNINSYNPVSDYLMYLKLNKSIKDFYEPFYFKKTEVTNKEYREFVNWVIDSIARNALAKDGLTDFLLHPEDKTNLTLNKKTKIYYDSQNVKEILEFLYLPPEERFYKRREIDARKINYVYSDKNGSKCIINVYPDTLVWLHNFLYPQFEPLSNMYFWHPAFNDYPVVGITQRQANAFLIWKTRLAQDALDAKKSIYTIKYELPNEMEWEMIATKSKNEIYFPAYENLYDHTFNTDLILKDDTCNTTLRKIVVPSRREMQDTYYFIFPKRIRKLNTNASGQFPDICLYKTTFRNMKNINYPDAIINSYKDENGILFMGGNVSEWMKDTYKENWFPVYTYHKSKLKKINSKYSKMQLQLEDFYNSQNDTNGVLVRGGNWYDLSLANISNKNFDGMNKKLFVNPDKSFATVGFRYVVKIYLKDEESILLKNIETNK